MLRLYISQRLQKIPDRPNVAEDVFFLSRRSPGNFRTSFIYPDNFICKPVSRKEIVACGSWSLSKMLGTN